MPGAWHNKPSRSDLKETEWRNLAWIAQKIFEPRPMFIHKSILLHEVRVGTPDPVFAEKLLEQYGGAAGELTAALTYWTQSFHVNNPGVRDMLQDIGPSGPRPARQSGGRGRGARNL